MKSFYNEYDKNAAAWLRELCVMNLITNGNVDERSITEVSADDLRGFTQCHFFAGIGGWSLALRLAGIPDDYPVWTASLPCQPFSTAGKQLGKADERHLLPHFLELVNACKPSIIFGEQVPGAIRHGWLDDLCDAMEREGYTVRAAVLTAAGVGAAHIRQRLYWVAYRSGEGYKIKPGNGRIPSETHGNDARENIAGIGCMGDANSHGCKSRSESTTSARYRDTTDSTGWHDPQWIYCRDNKYRPIKPGIKPLVNGIPKGMGYGGDTGSEEDADNTQEARVMRLKGYGNAVIPAVAAEFISAFMSISHD